MPDASRSDRPAIVALAGRRVDAEGANPRRFPLHTVPLVRQRLAEALTQQRAAALVCSAACGADLLALEEAERMGLRRRIVLPFAPDRFRETSVMDRPGDWGAAFDRLVAAAQASGDLVVLEGTSGGAAYALATEAIVREAQLMAKVPDPHRLVAVVVWEGAPKPQGDDATEGFRDLAVRAGFEAIPILTL